jgi:protein-S-isoprenylcysteine O-methyltransferase Ste14
VRIPLSLPIPSLSLSVSLTRKDERICEAKYGAAWQAYKRAVPYRIIPYVY